MGLKDRTQRIYLNIDTFQRAVGRSDFYCFYRSGTWKQLFILHLSEHPSVLPDVLTLSSTYSVLFLSEYPAILPDMLTRTCFLIRKRDASLLLQQQINVCHLRTRLYFPGFILYSSLLDNIMSRKLIGKKLGARVAEARRK